MKDNFLRKDLNLGGRWWHRLFLVIFFVFFALALCSTFIYLFFDNNPYIPKWKVVSSVADRMTTDVKQIRELKKNDGERVAEKGAYYSLNSSEDDSLYANFYCSSDLANKIIEAQNKSGIYNLSIRNIYNRDNVPLEIFAGYIRDNDVKCLVPDSYTYPLDARIRFLEPLGSNQMYGKDLVFYERSNLLTAFYILKMFILVIVIFAGIAIFYYKVFLYIIFGSANRSK